jgi:hypothetical protein
MKRLTTLAVVALSLTAVSIALAAGGLGKFETKITGKSAKTEHGSLDGLWTVDFAIATSGKVKLTRNGKPAGGGKYVISGSTITLTPKNGGTCKSKGKYHFKLSGKALTFTTISDPCADRRHILTYGPWTKVG